MDYLVHNIAINLNHIRKSKGMSLDVVAEQTGVSKSMLAAIEKGAANPSIGVLGKIMSYMHYGIKSDIVSMAKALGGGMPIGAICAREEVAKAFTMGSHGTTFGGNPLACAAANVVLDTVPKPEFLAHVEEVGSYFKQQLEVLKAKHPALITEVRGTGLILGAELASAEHGRDIVNDCLAEGAIINRTAGKVLRFIPPLIITQEQVDAVIATLDDVLAKYDK